jgi:nitrite reductase (NADH) large subunit
MNGKTKEILGDEKVAGVLLEDGQIFEADLVVVAAGVRPNSQAYFEVVAESL